MKDPNKYTLPLNISEWEDFPEKKEPDEEIPIEEEDSNYSWFEGEMFD